MAIADERTLAAPRVAWEADGPWPRCVVGWPGDRPSLSRVLPIFEHLGLVLADHRPDAAADTFLFAEVDDPRLEEMMPLRAEAFSAAWEGTVDRDQFAALVVEAHLSPRHKLDPAQLPFPNDPAVRVETFLHHRDVEGLHARYGAVARGGLRWSDRVEDYRNEVLALAKAQQVKAP